MQKFLKWQITLIFLIHSLALSLPVQADGDSGKSAKFKYVFKRKTDHFVNKIRKKRTYEILDPFDSDDIIASGENNLYAELSETEDLDAISLDTDQNDEEEYINLDEISQDEECRLESTNHRFVMIDKLRKKIEHKRELDNACSTNNVLKKAKQKLKPEEYEKFNEFLNSWFFYDKDMILYENMIKGNEKEWVNPQFYNQNGEYPIDGYFSAKKKLKNKSPRKINAKFIKKLHKDLLSARSIKPQHIHPEFGAVNSGNVRDESLDKFRTANVFYPGRGNTKEHTLNFSDGIKLREEPLPYDRIHEINEFLYKSSDDRVAYPTVDASIWEIASRGQEANWDGPPWIKLMSRNGQIKLKDAMTELNKVWQDLKDGKRDEAKPKYSDSDHPYRGNDELYDFVISDLINNQVTVLNNKLKKNKGNKKKLIKAVGTFYRNFMSIHPFNDGNGRIGRVLLEHLLNGVGLPSPIWTAWGQDVEITNENLVKFLEESVERSQKFHNQFCKAFDSMSERKSNDFNISDVDIAPILDLDVPTTTKDFKDWFRTEKQFLHEDKKHSGWGYSTRVANPLRMFIETRKNGTYSPQMDILDEDDAHALVQKRRNFINSLATRLAEDEETYTWMPENSTDARIRDGIKKPDHTHPVLITNDTMAGDGLYVSENPWDSSYFAVRSGPMASLLKVTLPKGHKVLDLRNPATVELLEGHGITPDEVLRINPEITVRYPTHFGDFAGAKWLAIKSGSEGEGMKFAKIDENVEDKGEFATKNLLFNKARLAPNAEKAHELFDKIIAKRKADYTAEMDQIAENLTNIGAFFTKFGECGKITNGKFEIVGIRECAQNDPFNIKYDKVSKICYVTSTKSNIFIKAFDSTRFCQGQIPDESESELWQVKKRDLVSDEPTQKEIQLLAKNHFWEDTNGNYWILQRSEGGTFLRKGFASKDDALTELLEIPSPIDLTAIIKQKVRLFKAANYVLAPLVGKIETKLQEGITDDNMKPKLVQPSIADLNDEQIDEIVHENKTNLILNAHQSMKTKDFSATSDSIKTGLKNEFKVKTREQVVQLHKLLLETLGPLDGFTIDLRANDTGKGRLRFYNNSDDAYFTIHYMGLPISFEIEVDPSHE